MNAAPSLDTLRALPSNRLEALRRDRAELDELGVTPTKFARQIDVPPAV